VDESNDIDRFSSYAETCPYDWLMLPSSEVEILGSIECDSADGFSEWFPRGNPLLLDPPKKGSRSC